MITTKSNDPMASFDNNYYTTLSKQNREKGQEYRQYFDDKLKAIAEENRKKTYEASIQKVQEENKAILESTNERKEQLQKEIEVKLEKHEMLNLLKGAGLKISHLTGEKKLLELCKTHKLV